MAAHHYADTNRSTNRQATVCLTQGYGILKRRQALDWRTIWPLSLGTTIGIPLGLILLNHINPVSLRFGVGALFYTVYPGLVQRVFPSAVPGPVSSGSLSLAAL